MNFIYKLDTEYIDMKLKLDRRQSIINITIDGLEQLREELSYTFDNTNDISEDEICAYLDNIKTLIYTLKTDKITF